MKATQIAGVSLDNSLMSFLATQADTIRELLTEGPEISKRKLAMVLVSRMISPAALSDDEAVKCGTALAAVAIDLAALPAEELATLGLGGWLGVLMVLADVHGAARDCRVQARTMEWLSTQARSESTAEAAFGRTTAGSR